MGISKAMVIVLVVLIPIELWGQASATNQSPTTTTNISNTVEETEFLKPFYESDRALTNVEPERQFSPFWSTVKIIFYTVLLGVIAYFVIRLLISRTGIAVTDDEELVNIIMTKQVGMGNYIQIIRIGPAFYLISLSNEGIRLLDKIVDKETVEFLEINLERLKPKKEKRFLDILSFFPLSKKGDKIEFMRKQQDRLKKM